MSTPRSAAAQAVAIAASPRIETRPLRPDDRVGLAQLFERLSPESRYRRFFELKRELKPRELDWLTVVDHVDHEAIVAVDQRDGSLVGVSRYVRDKDRPTSAELAIAVVDDRQRCGIGTVLVKEIVRRATANGLEQLTAVALGDNRPVHALLRRLGFQVVGRSGREVELSLPLDRPDGIVVALNPRPASPRGARATPRAASPADAR
jgi:RimJ/RimL family protein N-acetyltransferase